MSKQQSASTIEPGEILAIDPGNVQSAVISIGIGDSILSHGIYENNDLLQTLRKMLYTPVLVIEQIRSYGMAVGATVFDTCVWSGMFAEACQPCQLVWMPRKEVKLELCGSPRAKDGNIRAALLDLYGGKDRALGRKASPGPLFGFRSDEWAALGVACTFLAHRRRRAAGTLAEIFSKEERGRSAQLPRQE
jgi:hypothetical protein